MASNTAENSTVEDTSLEQAGEATMLVSEFPPPPFYYTRGESLQPPEIPTEALERGTRRAAAAAARARAEAERLRLGEDEIDKTGAILGGATEEEENDGDVVAVFGEIVEDPVLIEPLDYCEDPRVIRDEVKRLNATVLKEFVMLVRDLVHRPQEHKVTRDSLSHNIFLMLQECNKFREHQSREILIELLEEQLSCRKKLLLELQEGIDKADSVLGEGRL